MSVLEAGIKLIEKINTLGYEAYIVGGAVRDYLLNIEINDVDITTNTPLDVLKSSFKYIDNGSDFISITIIFDTFEFEITHFRRDIEYKNHRHPVVMECDTLYEDIVRRDFTINSLAMDSNYKIYDFFEGQADIKNKVIRTINDPNTRFDEDALRILRGLYLINKTGFSLSRECLEAMINKRHLLAYLSHERLMEYTVKIANQNSRLAGEYIEKYNLFEYIGEYKNWLTIINPTVSKDNYVLLYYKKYNEYPSVSTSKDIKLCDVYNEVKTMDLYSLYKNQAKIDELKNILDNYVEIKNIISAFPIHSDKELSMSKEEIASHFNGPEKSLMIKRVISAILHKEINNNYEEIKHYILGR